MATMSEELGHRTVTDASVTAFGCLTGDYARMHFDLDFGPSQGMASPIAHGLLSAAWSLGALTLQAPTRLGVGDPASYLSGFEMSFLRTVSIGDCFSLRWSPGEGPTDPGAPLETRFETVNQAGEVTGRGTARVTQVDVDQAFSAPSAPAPMAVDAWRPEDVDGLVYGDDMLDRGPRGISVGRTMTEGEIVQFASFSGELNPLYLNAEFARAGLFGRRIAPPMLGFCLGFGDFLRDLLSAPMPSSGFAGHLGDSFRFFAPIEVGDTIRVRHQPIGFKASKSRPGMGIVEFGLQLENQREEIVQDGSVMMMIPTREAGTAQEAVG